MMNDLQRGIVDIFPEVNLDEFLSKSRRIKLGFDPTSNFLHLGHSILLRKLKEFQKNGHVPVIIIGDFTARIGDPTGKSSTRKQLSEEEIKENVKGFIKILKKFIDLSKCEIVFNSEHLSRLSLTDIIELQSIITVQQLLAKQDFSNRMDKEIPISLHEFTYPLLQGYDSFVINSEVELGGIDQKFNVSIGRDVQRAFKCSNQQIGMLMPILVGTDGTQKMSKSLNNAIAIEEHPFLMYSKLEKIPDSLVNDYITLLTDCKLDSFSDNPRERQKQMALEVTSAFYGMETAKLAQKNAEEIVLNSQSDNSSAEIPEISIASIQFPIPLANLLKNLNLVSGTSDAKRRIKSGAIKLAGTKVEDDSIIIESSGDVENQIIQLSKRELYRFKQ